MKTRRFCPKCGRPVLKSRIKGYSFRCLYCDEDFCRFEVLRKKDLPLIKELQAKDTVFPFDKWWYSADFCTMEIITGYRQFDFDPEEGYQGFVDACDGWWEALSRKEKINLWKEYK
ncbi:MAG: hypothetical protein LBT24_01400 [Tannerella sp.]|jgi:hypothetical protein|nr:hypothetical protein [Tannerella sp.]